ncbi:unnamed protein product [Somion occarium]|uniref:Extracellular serine-rich protein n=1 Tax=Somion occarium TaxID=3059160 RepID=A0ABP1CW63_9APHY
MRFAYALAALSATLPAALADIINVEVGANSKLQFYPEFVQAKRGDIVRFSFNPKAHSVTQSSFDTPCIKSLPGFNSGFDTDLQPVSPDQVTNNQRPTKDFFVADDSHPLWFYCKQVGHCGQGMVFAINPPSSGNTFDAFKARAIQQNGTSVTSSAAAPTQTVTPKLCAPKDNYGGALIREDPPKDGFVTCQYQQGGTCTYFANGGSFSSGSSVCPKSVPGQSGQSGNGQVNNGQNNGLPTPKLCAAKDNRGSPLTAESGVDNGLVTCTYPQAGFCTYVAQGGSFSSGSSVCPKSIPGSGGAGDGLPTPKLCAAKDNRGSPLTAESGVDNGLVTCTYPQAGFCTYFAQGGSFSSGSSVCPTSIPGQSKGNVNAVSGALGDNDDDSSSPDLNTLLRNSYIIIGLLAAVLIGLIAVSMIMCIGRRGLRGKEAKYSKVTVPKAFQGIDEEASMTHGKRYSDI